ncbi:uncharacterized protein [Physcomitrium patens]|uniref:uncharacterized protein n=1 Tax=Physcomitrium patens TaxID=3218 RepID=UPI000D165740|nr:uncharacterized protein LOC112290036 [Physcomitrium patens]XP_024391693.1 uncharacterized protein LOC112290036 [Physcomitrium patens]|eukprot:XP_024391692.1 uncharacterized protein LOC112290036 [Physcomitrella patens]
MGSTVPAIVHSHVPTRRLFQCCRYYISIRLSASPFSSCITVIYPLVLAVHGGAGHAIRSPTVSTRHRLYNPRVPFAHSQRLTLFWILSLWINEMRTLLFGNGPDAMEASKLLIYSVHWPSSRDDNAGWGTLTLVGCPPSCEKSDGCACAGPIVTRWNAPAQWPICPLIVGISSHGFCASVMPSSMNLRHEVDILVARWNLYPHRFSGGIGELRELRSRRHMGHW